MPKLVISPEKKSQILWLREMGCGQKELAKLFDMTLNQITRLVPKKFKWSRLTVGQIEEMKKLRAKGFKLADIGKKFGIADTIVGMHVKGVVPDKIKRKPRALSGIKKDILCRFL